MTDKQGADKQSAAAGENPYQPPRSQSRGLPLDEHQPPKANALNVVRGVLMGGADVIPGVSGGTVALILGIYQPLVTAISHFDHHLLSHVKKREWRAAANRVHLPFLITLGTGIALGIVLMAIVLGDVLKKPESTPFQLTMAIFYGLILASTIRVAQMVRPWTLLTTVLAITGALFAFWLTGLLAMSAGGGLGYIFFCGAVAICAMILPGISGAFVLLILGSYDTVLFALKDLLHGQVTSANLSIVFVFIAGCAVGILSFSKVLKYLLAHYHDPTMAMLCGFMFGALRRIWPFKSTVDGDYHVTLNEWPTIAEAWPAALVALLAIGGFLIVDRLGHTRQHLDELVEEAEEETSSKA